MSETSEFKSGPNSSATAKPKIAVLVIGPSEAAVRRFLAAYVKPAFGMKKPQWQVRYRSHYGLMVLSRPLRAGEKPQEAYGAHAEAGALVLACLPEKAPGSGLAATRAWLKKNGFAVEEFALELGGPEYEAIEQGADIVNFVNLSCPWRGEEVADIDAYLAKHNKPFWE